MRVRRPLPAARHVPAGGLTLALAAGVLIGSHTAGPAAADPVHLAPAATVAHTPMTAARASTQSRATGQPVVADAMTTPTSQTTANPDGTFTLTTSPTPVRARKNGTWVSLDATLSRNGDGTYSPAASTGALVLSGGGSGPLAMLDLGGRQLSVTLPAALPTPTISGDTATYPSILPDTDLVVTATAQGGYSDVFVVKSAAAATNPTLSNLMKASVAASGLTVASDTAGELTATDPGGATLFTAPTATAWDSTTTAVSSAIRARAAAPSPSPTPTPTGVDPVSGAPLTSSVDGPGEHAHTAPLNATYTAGTLTLTPPASLLTGSTTTYPVYLDPSVGPAVSAWTMVNSAFPDQSYYGVGTKGHMQVGDNGVLEGCAPCFTARSFTTLNLSGVPAGAVVSDAQVNFWEDVAPSCSPRNVDLYVTGPIYPASSPTKTTWNHQPSWGASPIGTANVAKGYSGCSAGGVGFGIKNQVISALSGGKTLTLGLQAHDESDEYAWKQFNGNVPGETATNASVTYDLYPNTPSGLKTSPSTNCASGTVGDTGMALYAAVSSPVGNNLTTTFNLYRYGDTNNLLTPANNISSDQYQGPSGQPAVLSLPESFFKTLAAGKASTFSWVAQSTDGTLTSGWTKTPCTFTWDPTRPGNPAVAPTTGLPTGGSTIDCPLTPTTATIPPIGSTCGFTVTPPNGATVSGYVYQLNDAPPVNISLGSDATKPVGFTLTLPGLVNTLTVSALSAGGNVGSSTTVWFDGATLNPPAKDGDLDHDATPDLILPGQTGSAFPPGLWLATGHADGTTATNAINVGTAGLWSGTPNATSPGDWTGSQTITGDFCGNGAQDVLAYFPGTYSASNPHGGGGEAVCSNANSSPLDVINPIDGSYPYGITEGTLVDSGQNAAGQVANAGNLTGKNAGDTDPDLLATIGDSLYLFQATNPAAYTTDFDSSGKPECTMSCADLSQQNTPDGSKDWSQWTIASAQDTRNDSPVTDLYLWNRGTGDLYLWTGLTTSGTFPNTTALTYAHNKITSGWNTGKNLTLRAADINGDGIPDLWATDPSGATVAYMPTALQDNPPLKTATTAVNTADHAWLFQDINNNTAGSALSTSADSAGSLTLTGTSGAAWNTGDLYSPDAILNTNPDGTVNTTGTGQLSTGGPAVPLDTTDDFTVAARVRANALGGTVLSQDGTNTAGFTLSADKTSGDWQFCTAQSDTANPARDCATGSPVQLGLWTALTATYNHKTGVMTLYVNGADTAMVSHSAATAAFTGNFRIGAQCTAAPCATTTGAYYTGQVADVHTWNQVAPPAQPQTGGSVFIPLTPKRIMDTRNGTGGTTGPIAANTTVPLQITGTGGVISDTGVTAVALSITDTAATSTGHLTIYPDGTAQPNTSAVNFPTATTVANGAIIPVGTDGKIDIFNEINTGTGSSQILADITGYFTTTAGAPNVGTYTPAGPVRALDTRNGTGANKAPLAAGSTLALTVTGINTGTGTIPTAVTAVAVDIAVTNPATGGYLNAYPDSSATPATTTISFSANQTIAAAGIIPVANGKIDLHNASGGTLDAIADIVGYFTPGTGGQKYHPLDATRLLDTRLSNTPFKADEARPVQQTVISAVSPTLVTNLTATQETGGGNLTALPENTNTFSAPTTTTLVYNTTGSIANLDLAATQDGYLTVLNYSSATTHLIIDTNGYFASY